MSGNHLLPIYYNTTRLTPKRRKKKKVSEKELKLRLEHEKFLLRMGYDNKGNLVVLSKSDSKDESTGKRR